MTQLPDQLRAAYREATGAVPSTAIRDFELVVGQKAWATCPLTENGVMRIVGHPRYPHSPGSPAVVANLLALFRELPGHAFWHDDVSLLDREHVDPARLLDSGQVTDSYLLALARTHKGQLATLDQRLIPDAVIHGAQALHPIR